MTWARLVQSEGCLINTANLRDYTSYGFTVTIRRLPSQHLDSVAVIRTSQRHRLNTVNGVFFSRTPSYNQHHEFHLSLHFCLALSNHYEDCIVVEGLTQIG